jgi:hypothetical protein
MWQMDIHISGTLLWYSSRNCRHIYLTLHFELQANYQYLETSEILGHGREVKIVDND